MNLYLRYFDDECVVTSVDDALSFISNIQGFAITPQFVEEFRQYAEGPMPYPKRYKVRSRIYFIVIKTTAASLEEFKANGKTKADAGQGAMSEDAEGGMQMGNEAAQQTRTEDADGWYEASIKFRRVVLSPITGKFDYKDTTFVAQLKAQGPQDCYNRVVSHLRSRKDIDQRSQYPSMRGKNFNCKYIGEHPTKE